VRRARALSLLLSLALLGAACSDGGGSAAPAGGGMQMPPPQVGVVTVQPEAVALQTELPGRVEALRTAQVRARVNGVVQQRLFREGSEVRAGQPLMRIDPAPYQAALASSQAQLQRAEAAAAQARLTAQRLRPLADMQAVSEQDAVNAEAQQQVAQADVAAARAAVQVAQLNLSYATVTAPIAGRIGRALVTEGALVSAAEATPLALIQQTSTVLVNFTQSSAELLRLQRALASGEMKARSGNGNGNGVPVRIVLEDGSELPRAGRLLFSDLAVDAATGQVTLRAEVPNPQGLLLPGQYVRGLLAQATLPAALRVPQQAVTRTAQGDTLMVVGEGNRPAARTVRIAGASDGHWIVTEGLQAGERVIVDGFQKMMVPGAPVNPVPWAPPSAAPASGAGAAAPAPAASAPR
jgi:membrane fusion protein (multidrug efflux system)